MNLLRRTGLFEQHSNLGARFVEFSGWTLPVQFTSIVKEHQAVRASAGVFDVSHMGRFELSGPDAHTYLQEVLSNDLDSINAGEAQYTLLLNEAGGIVDDLIAYRRLDDGYLIVGNAANRALYVSLFPLANDISDETAMLAVQGPEALTRLGIDIKEFAWRDETVLGIKCMVAGTGYTGERGCELICQIQDAEVLWQRILQKGVVPCGIGARETLRLEVCYRLHGQDITASGDPYSAGLGWVVSQKKSFVGSDALAVIRNEGIREKLVAFVMQEKGIPRTGMPVLSGGIVTSGAYSPMLETGIGLAYVKTEDSAPGTDLVVDIRGRERHASIVECPIYRSKEG